MNKSDNDNRSNNSAINQIPQGEAFKLREGNDDSQNQQTKGSSSTQIDK